MKHAKIPLAQRLPADFYKIVQGSHLTAFLQGALYNVDLLNEEIPDYFSDPRIDSDGIYSDFCQVGRDMGLAMVLHSKIEYGDGNG